MFKNWFRCGAAALVMWCLLAICNTAAATTYYVRTDGGTSTQCTGLADASYPGSGSGKACAWNNPQWALPPGYTGDGAKPIVLKSGDTLTIGSGSYEFGYGSPGAVACQSAYTYACYVQQQMPNSVTITGQSCSAPPVIWGSGHVYNLFDLSGTSGVTLSCLELTDHSTCIDSYQPTSNTGGVTACKTSYPAGDSAQVGILVQGAANLTLSNLNIHGLTFYGVNAGRLTGTTKVTNVTIRANGWGGWNGDLGGNDASSSDSGTLTFTNLIVEWNGCAEAYPSTTIVGCWGQNEGGYGDGFSESQTGGAWTFENSQFNHNTQDGLDLLYADGTGSITMDRLTASQNAGNGIKTAGPATLQNSVVNGYCNNWAGFPIAGDGSNGVAGTMCRADGTAVVMEFASPGGTVKPNETITLQYNTITGDGDTLFIGGAENGTVPASDVVNMANNIWLGQSSVIPRDDGAYTGLDWYSDGTYKGTVVYANNIVWHVKSNDCPATSICKDPKLTNETMAGLDPTLSTGSPAIAAAKGSPVPGTDYYGNARANPTSIGALEYGSSGSGGGGGSGGGSGGGGSHNVPPRAVISPVVHVCGKGGACINWPAGMLPSRGEVYSRIQSYIPRPAYIPGDHPYLPRPVYGGAVDTARL